MLKTEPPQSQKPFPHSWRSWQNCKTELDLKILLRSIAILLKYLWEYFSRKPIYWGKYKTQEVRSTQTKHTVRQLSIFRCLQTVLNALVSCDWFALLTLRQRDRNQLVSLLCEEEYRRFEIRRVWTHHKLARNGLNRSITTLLFSGTCGSKIQ